MDTRTRFETNEPLEVEIIPPYERYAREDASFTPNHSSPRLNIMLFMATVLTTTLAGTLLEAEAGIPFLAQLYKGLPFSITLLTILLFHEFGHYLTARKHHVDATLPYFIPAPSIIGTFGAVIKMRSRVHSKRVLFDIGAAGPLAGVIVAIPATVVGLKLSTIQDLSEVAGGGMSLGSSLLFSGLAYLSIGDLPQNHDIFLHPVAFAGWIGLLVTMLNLIPVGQLDGGHIAYAVLGRGRHQKIAAFILPLLLFLGLLPVPEMLLPLFRYFFMKMGFVGLDHSFWWLLYQDGVRRIAGYGWIGWLLWSLLLRYLIKPFHPPTEDEYTPLDNRRKIIGWIALAIFILTFTPAPFHVSF